MGMLASVSVVGGCSDLSKEDEKRKLAVILENCRRKGFLNPELALEHLITRKMSLGRTREESIQELYTGNFDLTARRETASSEAPQKDTVDRTRTEQIRMPVFTGEQNAPAVLIGADVATRIRVVLERWKGDVPGFNYSLDSHGNFTFHFREANVIVIPSQGHAVCRVDPYSLSREHAMPPVIAELPLSQKLLDDLSTWHAKYVYAELEPYVWKDMLLVTTEALLPRGFVTAASLLHSLVELTDGYWELAKAFFDSGQFEAFFNTFRPDERARAESTVGDQLRRIEEVRTGLLTGDLLDRLLPRDLVLSVEEGKIDLPFRNLIGDVGLERARWAERMESSGVSTDFLGPGHIDVYTIESRYVRNFILPVKRAVQNLHREFQIETIHQGFPARRRPWGREIFLGVRFIVKLADRNVFGEKELEEWKEAQLFMFRHCRIPFEYAVRKDSVDLLATLPLSVLQQHNIVYDEFPIDGQIMETALARAITEFPSWNEEDVNFWRKYVQELKASRRQQTR